MPMTFDSMRVFHFIPGRLRLRLDRLRGRPELARQFEVELAAVPGVRRVLANPVTGSLLLEYRVGSLRSAESLVALEHAVQRLFPVAEADRLRGWLDQWNNGSVKRASG